MRASPPTRLATGTSRDRPSDTSFDASLSPRSRGYCSDPEPKPPSVCGRSMTESGTPLLAKRGTAGPSSSVRVVRVSADRQPKSATASAIRAIIQRRDTRSLMQSSPSLDIRIRKERSLRAKSGQPEPPGVPRQVGPHSLESLDSRVERIGVDCQVIPI